MDTISLTRLPDGNAVSLRATTAVIHSPKKGVLVKGQNDQAIAWVAEKDDHRARIIRDELIKAVEASHRAGRAYQPVWDQILQSGT